MKNEPEIVKQLKDEEQRGSLQQSALKSYKGQSPHQEFSDIFFEKNRTNDERELFQRKTIQVDLDIQKKLLESEEKYEKIFRLSPEAIALLDKTGIFLDINERLRDWLGYRPEEVIGKNIFELSLLTPEGKSVVKKNFVMRFSGKEIDPYEVEFLTKRGEKRIGLVRGASIKDRYGLIIEDLVMVSDITEQKKQETSLRQLAAIVESSEDAIIGKTLDGIIVSWNKGAEKIYGYSAKEMIGRSITQLIPPECPNDVPQILEKIQRGEQVHHYETTRMTKEGKRIYVSLAIAPLKDATGNIIGASAIARDISNLKIIEEQLKESEEKFRNISMVALDGIIMTDFQGNVSFWNQAAQRIFGYSQEEVYGKNLHFLLAPSHYHEEYKKGFELFQKTGSGPVMKKVNELVGVRKDKTEFPIELSLAPFQYNKQWHAVGIVRDITERKKMEQDIQTKMNALEKSNSMTLNIMEDLKNTIHALQQAEKEIKEKNERLQSINQQLCYAQQELSHLNMNLEVKVKERTKEVEQLLAQKDDFINQFGHDLKTPLTPLTTLLPLARSQIQDPKLAELLDISIKNAEFMKNLVFKTLKLAELNTPDTPFDMAQLNLSDVVNNLIENKKIKCQENNISVKNMIDSTLLVEVNKIQLSDLLENLFSNAIKFTPQGGSITFHTQKKDNMIILSVHDTGIGMTSEEIKHLFHEFYKADISRHDLESNGLGLAICKRIAEKHGGTIWAESEGKGKGSTFSVTLKIGKM